jgi:hypothetical protein
MVLLGAGLAAVLVLLGLQTTSVAQAVALAVPVALLGAGLERVGRWAALSGLRSLGVLVLVVAVAGPVFLATAPPGATDRITIGSAITPGATEAVLRANPGSGQLGVRPGGPGLFEADLRSAGRSSGTVTSSGNTVIVDLRGPGRRGLLARNRGSDWAAAVSPALPWRVEVDAGALTGDLDLQRLNLRSARVDAGFGRFAVRLGMPSGRTAVDLRLNAGTIDLYLPARAALDLSLEGMVVRELGARRMQRTATGWRTEGAAGPGYVIRADVGAGLVRLHWR